jgi:translation machinery-associated protein 16
VCARTRIFETGSKREYLVVRTGFFKVATKDATAPLDLTQIRELIERLVFLYRYQAEDIGLTAGCRWVHRDDHELERYEAERRPGRPPVAKHLELKNRIEKEVEEFRTGFYVPDLQDFDNIMNLQRWDGKTGSLAQVKFTRVPQEDPLVPVDKMEM